MNGRSKQCLEENGGQRDWETGVGGARLAGARPAPSHRVSEKAGAGGARTRQAERAALRTEPHGGA